MRLSRAEFEQVVRDALRALPAPIRHAVEDVPVFVQDFPEPDHLRCVGLDDRWSLFGLYEGVSLLERSVEGPPALPARIWIFQRPLEAACATREELMDEIRETVIHEVGHHLGLDEDDLEELEEMPP